MTWVNPLSRCPCHPAATWWHHSLWTSLPRWCCTFCARSCS